MYGMKTHCLSRMLWIVVLGFGSHGMIWSEQPAAKPKNQAELAGSWTMDDIMAMEFAADPRFAPRGGTIIWVKETPNEKKGKIVHNLMLTDLSSPREIPLTRGGHHCHAPRWSPSGDQVAFLSDRPPPDDEDDNGDAERVRLWCIDPRGGEPWLLLSFPRDIQDFAWLDDDTIVFTAEEKPGHEEQERTDKKDGTEVVEDATSNPPVRLFRFDLPDQRITRISRNQDRIEWLAVSPDGRYVVASHQRSLSFTYDHRTRPEVVLYDLNKEESRPLFTDRKFFIRRVVWRPDSRGFYAVSAYTSHPRYLMASVEHLYYLDARQGEPVAVDLDWERGLALEGEELAVTNDGFVTLLADGVRHRAARYTYDGTRWQRRWLEGEHVSHIQSLQLAANGQTLLYLYSKASGPRQWYVAQLRQNQVTAPRQVFTLAPDLTNKRLARTEAVRWRGAETEEVEGLLYYPLDYQPGRRYPLVVQIHGGPAWADFDRFDNRWSYPSHLYSARGAFVFKPNYHGSTHYGLAWAESLADGKYYELPVVDIEKGIDHLVQRGLVDADRVALAGWSNGAILTMALLTRRPTYQAAAAGAGGAEWVADWGACEFGLAFSNYYLGKSPLEDPHLYIKNAPFYQFDKIRTPTLLFQGKEDRVVPVHHGWMQYRALQQLGKAPVRYVLFPGEEHGLERLAHQRRKMAEELAWFDRYLFQTTPTTLPPVKADSPLALALQRQHARRHGQRYGVLHTDRLIPETVAWNGLHVGRFEVTRAQFAQFDPQYEVAPGTDNYPANGITFPQAKAYCAWLSQWTGQTYRLGTWEEMHELYQSTERLENTLDHWAGYAVTPEDRAQLQPVLRRLEGKAPLLREVGQFAGYSATIPLFDLGGNVAEWVSTPAGGKVLGGSADRSADDLNAPPAPDYIGLRVVRE
ncbi:MAG: prolyl oligopeptidase family serine peptidase [Gemmataceae bacterium]